MISSPKAQASFLFLVHNNRRVGKEGRTILLGHMTYCSFFFFKARLFACTSQCCLLGRVQHTPTHTLPSSTVTGHSLRHPPPSSSSSSSSSSSPSQTPQASSYTACRLQPRPSPRRSATAARGPRFARLPPPPARRTAAGCAGAPAPPGAAAGHRGCEKIDAACGGGGGGRADADRTQVKPPQQDGLRRRPVLEVLAGEGPSSGVVQGRERDAHDGSVAAAPQARVEVVGR